MVLAYSIAAMTRGTKGLPALESLLIGHKQQPQSAHDMRTQLEAISQLYKLPLRRKRKEATRG